MNKVSLLYFVGALFVISLVVTALGIVGKSYAGFYGLWWEEASVGVGILSCMMCFPSGIWLISIGNDIIEQINKEDERDRISR